MGTKCGNYGGEYKELKRKYMKRGEAETFPLVFVCEMNSLGNDILIDSNLL